MLSGMWNELNWKKASWPLQLPPGALAEPMPARSISRTRRPSGEKTASAEEQLRRVSTNNIPPAMEKLSMGSSPSGISSAAIARGVAQIDRENAAVGRLPIRVNVEGVAADFAKEPAGKVP